jgi:adenylate cyclase
MTETRRLAAILAADVAGYSRLTGADEEGTVVRLRALRRELIEPTIASHHGRVVKTAGDGMVIEFASVVDAVRAAVTIQSDMEKRAEGIPAEKQIRFRIGVHLGDVLVETDGDLMGDGVNIAARLEGISEAGGMSLSEDAWRQVRDKVGASFADLGEHELKNIARPVRVYALRATSPAAGQSAGPLLREKAEQGRLSPPPLSIVVLPFANMSGDSEQEYFVDGLTEDLTTELSRMPGAFVIARNTAFTYKSKAVDMKAIGRDLGVRYALEGSARKAGGRIRLNVQLIDTETGAHLWADRFERELVDLFALQEAVTIELAGVLNVQLVEAETRRSRTKLHPDAFDLVLRGHAANNRGMARENNEASLHFYEEALRLDPGNVTALSCSAIGLALRVTSLWSIDRLDDLAQAEAMAERALALDPNDPQSHSAMGFVRRVQQRFDEAIIEYETVLRANPNFAFAHSELGWAYNFSGRFEQALPHFEESIRLSPRDPQLFLGYFGIGNLQQELGHFELAIEPLRRCIALNPRFSWPHLVLTVTLIQLQRMDAARAALAAYFRTNPAARTISAIRANAVSEGSANPRFFECLRLAGMPEE